jgi:hypothetical protein
MSGQATGWVLKHGPRDRAMRAVLVTIADAANAAGEHAHPGMEAMVEGSLYSRRSINAIIPKLIEGKWIRVEEVGGGRGKATVFTVLMDRENRQPLPVLERETRQKQGNPPVVEERETRQNTDIAPLLLNGLKDPTQPRKPFELDFVELWGVWRKKRDKAEALKAYQARRRDGVAHPLLMLAARAYISETKDKDPALTKGLGVFLHGPEGPWSEYLEADGSLTLPGTANKAEACGKCHTTTPGSCLVYGDDCPREELASAS